MGLGQGSSSRPRSTAQIQTLFRKLLDRVLGERRGCWFAAFFSRLISRYTKYEPFSMLAAFSLGWR